MSLATLSLASVLDAICPGGPLAPAATVEWGALVVRLDALYPGAPLAPASTVGWGALVVWGVLLLLVATLTVLAWCGCRGTLVPHQAILAKEAGKSSGGAEGEAGSG